jgi:hydrogenase expression/formation protein HypC
MRIFPGAVANPGRRPPPSPEEPMCLAVPMEITAIADKVADVEIGGVTKKVRLDIIDAKPAIGDFVIVHAGFAIHRLDREDALETIKLFQEGLNLELI